MLKFGWKPSVEELNTTRFMESNTLKNLAIHNQDQQYLIPTYIETYNQGELGSCVANATCGALEILKGIENPFNIQMLSRLFLYYNARTYDHSTDKDEGCYIHNALDSLSKLGVCLESTWEYSPDKVFSQPNQIAYKQGDDNTIIDFYQIKSNGEQRLKDIELAIRANHPVIFGTTIGKELENYDGSDTVFSKPKDSLGGHAMLITGIRYNPNIEFYIRNSWGPWGIKGHCWFNRDYITWNQTNDLFVPTRMTDLLL